MKKRRPRMKLLDSLLNRLPIGEAYAHCDIPCGIYDPITAKIAAQTVQKMVLRMESMEDGVFFLDAQA